MTQITHKLHKWNINEGHLTTTNSNSILLKLTHFIHLLFYNMYFQMLKVLQDAFVSYTEHVFLSESEITEIQY